MDESHRKPKVRPSDAPAAKPSPHAFRTAHVVAVKRRAVLLILEQRKNEGLQWRIPSGGVKEDESPEQGARRELTEETGRRCKRLVEFFRGKVTNHNFAHFFIATGITMDPNKLEGDEGEHIVKARYFPVDEAIALVQSSEVVHLKSLLALLQYARNAGGT